MLTIMGKGSRFLLITVLVALGAIALQGCVLVPFVQAFKESGLTESDRMSLLPGQVKKFSGARIFGNNAQALALVLPESRTQVAEQFREERTGLGRDEERIVRSKIDDIEWLDEARVAKVVVAIDSYKMSYLVVNTSHEEQQWEFSGSDGWLLKERKKVEG